ncbi:MAG: DUF3011 domain-containing protein [Edaphobacter sp.]
MTRITKLLLIAAIFTLCTAYAPAEPAAAAVFQGYGQPQGQVITCSSNDGKRHYCGIDTSRGVQLSRQISGSACIQGQTWGYDRGGVWVDRGCRAEFFTGRGMGGGRPHGQQMQIITCSSNDGRRNYCAIPPGTNPNSIGMTRQISGSACIQNQTWGVDGQGLWVDRGCRAEFSSRGGNGSGMWGGRGQAQIITCSSNDGRRNYCALPNGINRNRVGMTRQISGSACIQNQTWGVDRRGLWVDRGCRAEFQVNR